MIAPEIKVLPTPQAVAEAGAQLFAELSEAAIELRSRFTVALAGGSTPRAMNQILASPSIQSQIDWPAIDVFFGDERCVPPDDEQSNFRMNRDTLLSKVPMPGDNIYRMRGELPDHNEAAKEYGQMLKERFGDSETPGGGLDLIFLGMGPDGHTLSLFPNSVAVNETKHRCVANYVESMKSWRLTMTAPFVNRASHVVVMVCGADKAARLSEVLEGPRDPLRLPIQLIQPTIGKMTWLIDAAAAGMHE